MLDCWLIVILRAFFSVVRFKLLGHVREMPLGVREYLVKTPEVGQKPKWCK
jgi:hypothetical protein